MKAYELFLHWKQGDDFDSCLDNADRNATKAFNLWSDSFKHNSDICLKLANMLDGLNVDIQAGTHMINFTPKDKKAKKVLEMLVKENILSEVDWGSDDEENEE